MVEVKASKIMRAMLDHDKREIPYVGYKRCILFPTRYIARVKIVYSYQRRAPLSLSTPVTKLIPLVPISVPINDTGYI